MGYSPFPILEERWLPHLGQVRSQDDHDLQRVRGAIEASLFFRLVAYRYGRGSILITTNKGIRDWPELLAGDEVLATAILDRLLHHSHVLNIAGRSYRLRDLEQEVSLRS